MRKLNVRLAAILLVSLLVFGVAVYFVRALQVRRNAGFFKGEAEAALEEAKQFEAALEGAGPAEEEEIRRRRDEKYQDAVLNFSWYVRLRPDDVDALEQLGLLLADLFEQRRDRRSFSDAYGTLEAVLREDPARAKTRRKLVDLMMDPWVHRWTDAEKHLQKLLRASPDDPDLLELLARCQTELREYGMAIETYKQVIEKHPDRPENYARLAALLRNQVDRPAEADQWMAKLVESNPNSGEAHRVYGDYLLRVRRRDEDAAAVTARLEDALAHAERSIELEPDEAIGYQLAALCAMALRRFDRARECAGDAIEIKPEDYRTYSTLVDVELRAGKRDRAIEVLREGLEATDGHPALEWTLANLLIDTRQLDEVHKSIAKLERLGYAEARLGYLRARVELVQGNWKEAIRAFGAIRSGLVSWPDLAKQADFWVAECYGRLGNPDMRLKFLRRAVDVDPFFAPALAAIAEAATAAGQMDEAFEQYMNLIKMGRTVTGSAFARVMVLRELQKPKDQRNWGPVEKVLKQAAAEVASPQITVYRAEVLLAQGKLDEARELLLEAREKMPQAVEIWAMLASLAEREEKWDEAVALLKDAGEQVTDRVGLALARARYFVERHGKRAADQLRKMADQTAEFNDAEKLRYFRGMLAESMRLGDTDQVEKLARRILARRPDDVDTRFLLFDVAMRREDMEGMKRELEELHKLTGEGATWLYGRAVQLSLAARDGRDPALDRALEYLRRARGLRPSWGRVVLLMAGIYDQKGDYDRALDFYLEAVQMGERNPRALRRAIQLLYAQQRYNEAVRLMDDFGTVPEELTRAYSEMKFRLESFDEALELARKAAQGSKDPTDHMWLGQVCMVVSLRSRYGQELVEAEQLLAEAEQAFVRATEVAEDIAATWAALIRFYTETNQLDKAETAVARAEEKIPPENAAIALAQCYEAMNDTERAQKKYEEALAAEPGDPVTVRYAANFHLRTGNVAAAEELLGRLVDGDVAAGKSDRIWARRRLALLLATRPGYQNRQEALKLIEQNLAEEKDSVQDRRVKAGMLAKDPSTDSRQLAIQELEDLVAGQGNASADDLYELHQLYLAEGNWVKAAAQMRRLLADYGPRPRYLVPYVRALLDRGELSEAGNWLDRLEGYVISNSYTMVQLRSELLVRSGSPARAKELMLGFVDGEDAYPPDRLTRVRLMAGQFEELAKRLDGDGRAQAAAEFLATAESLLRQYVADRPLEALRLAAFLARQGRIDEALELVEDRWEADTPISLAGVMVALLRHPAATPEQLRRAEDVLKAALVKFDRSVPLLLVTADYYSNHKRYREAESHYREIINKNPNDAVALNNLAVLLALQGTKTDEALELINRAIGIAGPVAPMLDSRASVHLARGNPQDALKDLAGAIREQPTPVRRFHQAQAFEMAGQRPQAVQAMRQALDNGLTSEMLQPLERPAFERMRKLVP